MSRTETIVKVDQLLRDLDSKVQLDPDLEKGNHLDHWREEAYYDRVREVRFIMQDNLANLTGVELSVVQMRFSFNCGSAAPLTLEQVGERLDLSKERIRQLQNQALAKLQQVVTERLVAI